jgi:hypothetical protein
MVSIELLLALCNPIPLRKPTPLPIPDATDPEEYPLDLTLLCSGLRGFGNVGVFSAFAKLVVYTPKGGCQESMRADGVWSGSASERLAEKRRLLKGARDVSVITFTRQ